ncbi:hypothetical protein QSV08_09790 [Maribacter sp. BPC-D8]|uniref:toxin-antitoxin system YwqK family antitoxin n=1 Tax=Maribacter sp. BPC-D8 TaxID=3053613 RepID=UPI002B461490|nr:hypothetical protein [Maribacter sp. BPC-D8]WRI31527.1 hypothetical protein QSV08_09790 [Maribacter sp. BPC-D8]
MRNYKIVLLLHVFLVVTNLTAQKDTLYFNSRWNKTDKNNAAFFRLVPLEKEGNLFKVKDYYINGNLQMQGYWSNLEKETLHGNVTWYFEDGTKSIESEYKNGILEGANTIYKKGGQVSSKGIYKNNEAYSGSFIVYRLLQTYANGMLNGEEISYAENGKIATRGVNKNGKRFNGEFTNTQTEKTTYKDGKNDGFTTSYYDLNFIQKKQSYAISNGIKEGEEVSFHEDGKEKSRGINKAGMLYNGSFYNEYMRTIASYKDGGFHGPLTTFNEKGKIISIREYVNGKVSGRVMSTGLFENKICECVYQNEKPFNGKECKGYDVYEYVDGQLVKLTSYNSENEDEKIEIQFFQDKEKTKKIVNLNGETYELLYKQGKAYSGQDYDRISGSLTTFKNGAKEGPFKINKKYKGYIASGNFKQEVYDGKIEFENLESKTSTFCTYQNGKPIDGTAIYKDTIVSYKNGLKHGLETPMSAYGAYNSPFDSISRNYKEGKLHGQIQYFEESELIAEGLYQNNKPFTGVFYEYPGGTSYTRNTYNEGAQLKEEYIAQKFKAIYEYKDNKLQQGKFYYNEELIAEGLYKNEIPFEGSFATLEKIDKNYFPEKYTLTSYKKGEKNGGETVVNFNENSIEEITQYKNGKILSSAIFLPFKDKASLEGTYKNNMPFSGDFLTTLAINLPDTDTKSSYQSVSHYENGRKSGMEYFTTMGSNMQVVLDSVSYKDGKPFQGNLLEIYNSDTLQHHYEEGNLVQTNIYTRGLSKKPDAIVKYTAKGYTTTNERPSRDMTSYSSEVIYTNTDPSEGTAIITGNGNEIGRFSFSKKGISDASFSFKEYGTNVTIESISLNKINLVFDLENMRIKFESTLKPMSNIKPSDVQDWLRLFYFGDGPASFYLDGEETATATCIYKEGREYNGITANINENGSYNYNLYKKGELVKQQKNITKEQLVQLIQTKN